MLNENRLGVRVSIHVVSALLAVDLEIELLTILSIQNSHNPSASNTIKPCQM